jgi:hypothetical protein
VGTFGSCAHDGFIAVNPIETRDNCASPTIRQQLLGAHKDCTGAPL